MFLETVASFSASSPHFFRLFSENAEMATESALVSAGVLEGQIKDVCSKTLEIEQVDEGKKESVLVGQGACLETLSHMASFAHLRDTVSKAHSGLVSGLGFSFFSLNVESYV
ncbi:unnamed protein product [Symbiodinium sp. KB8]|nr:unnamed protein product [Symbiodinium sp. KB8]